MKKYLIIAFSFIMLHTHAMKVANNAMEKISSLPHDMFMYILQFSFPPIDLRYDEIKKGRISKDANENDLAYTKQHLPIVANNIITLRTVNKYWNDFIAHHITALLDLTKDTIDAFLIRATQAHIPYFIKIAIKNNANPNFFHKPDGYTPLLYAASANSYDTCKFLLEHKADVNLKMQSPGTFGYGYNHWCNWPIHIAVKKSNSALVTLFAKKGARLDIHINNAYSLLYVATKNNDPNTLTTLLNACPPSDYSKNWGLERIEHAIGLTTGKVDSIASQKCLELLQEAKKGIS